MRVLGVLMALACAPELRAETWSTTSAWVLSGRSFELGPPQRTIVRIEHAGGWTYGDNYIFFDINQADADGTNVYGEVVPRLSIGKLLGRDLRAGIVRDVLLTGAINAGTDFRAYLYGLSADLGVPGFAYLQMNLYRRDDANQAGGTWQFTPIWMVPFGNTGLRLQGFVDVAGTEGLSRRNLVAYTRLWLDVGQFWAAPGHIEAGLEYIYWNNKFGLEGVEERVLQPALRWTF
jgi:nucleoside-specific outer membrane channel protein Tsx